MGYAGDVPGRPARLCAQRSGLKESRGRRGGPSKVVYAPVQALDSAAVITSLLLESWMPPNRPTAPVRTDTVPETGALVLLDMTVVWAVAF